MVAFAVFSIIAAVNKNETLATSRAFTSLTLISILTLPVYTLLQALPAFWQCLGCFDRIQEYCAASADPKCAKGHGSSIELSAQSLVPSPDAAVIFTDVSLGWASLERPVLNGINMDVIRNSIIAVTGRVGSGKSTFLKGVLGEAICLSGRIRVSPNRIGYCAQSPWLLNDTVRNNILGFSTFHSERYAAVTWACALDEDIHRLPSGDATVVGSGATALSGGQQKRLVSCALGSSGSCDIDFLGDIGTGSVFPTDAALAGRCF